MQQHDKQDLENARAQLTTIKEPNSDKAYAELDKEFETAQTYVEFLKTTFVILIFFGAMLSLCCGGICAYFCATKVCKPKGEERGPRERSGNTDDMHVVTMNSPDISPAGSP